MLIYPGLDTHLSLENDEISAFGSLDKRLCGAFPAVSKREKWNVLTRTRGRSLRLAKSMLISSYTFSATRPAGGM